MEPSRGSLVYLIGLAAACYALVNHSAAACTFQERGTRMTNKEADALHRFLCERLGLQLANIRTSMAQLADGREASLLEHMPRIMAQLEAIEREAQSLARGLRGVSKGQSGQMATAAHTNLDLWPGSSR